MKRGLSLLLVAARLFTFTSLTLAQPTSEDDAAGWGSEPAADSSSPRLQGQPVEQLKPLHLDLKLRERVGAWLQRTSPSRLAQLRSSLELRASYSHDFVWDQTPASLRASAGARGEYDAVYLLSRAQYDAETLKTYEARLIGLETFIGLRLGVFELRSGRLITTLGQGEVQSAVDVLNPRDLRQIGATALEDIRLPAWTTHLSLSDAMFRIDAFVVHEAYFGMLPPLLGTYSPLRKLLSRPGTTGELPAHTWHVEHVPSRLDPRATQFVGRYGYSGGGFDIDLYAGSVLDQLGVAATPTPAELDRDTVPIRLYHPRYTLIALASAATVGDFVLRWELAAHVRKAQSVRRRDYQVPVIETRPYSNISGLLGFTYFGIPDVNLGVELMQSLVLNNPARDARSNLELLWPVEAPSLSLRYQHLLFDQRVTLHILSLITGIAPFNGALFNVGLTYLPRDGVSLLIEYIHYAASSHFGYFYGLEQNRRVDISLTWRWGRAL